MHIVHTHTCMFSTGIVDVRNLEERCTCCAWEVGGLKKQTCRGSRCRSESMLWSPHRRPVQTLEPRPQTWQVQISPDLWSLMTAIALIEGVLGAKQQHCFSNHLARFLR